MLTTISVKKFFLMSDLNLLWMSGTSAEVSDTGKLPRPAPGSLDHEVPKAAGTAGSQHSWFPAQLRAKSASRAEVPAGRNCQQSTEGPLIKELLKTFKLKLKEPGLYYRYNPDAGVSIYTSH